MQAGKWMRMWQSLAVLPLVAMALPAQAAFTPDPNGSIMLRAADPGIIYLDHGDFIAGAGSDQFAMQISRYWTDLLPSASVIETAWNEEFAGTSCMNQCGKSGHCAILGVEPTFGADNLFSIMSGNYRYMPYTMGCNLPSRAALAAFEHAANFGSAMHLCPAVDGTQSETMCELITADVFATLLLSRETGYDSGLIAAASQARSLMPLQQDLDFGEAAGAIRKAAVQAAADNPRIKDTGIYDQLVGGIFAPVIDPPTPYKQNCLENSPIFMTSAWRILQPRFELLRQPLMNKARDAFEEKPRQMDIGFPGKLLQDVATASSGTTMGANGTAAVIQRPRLATGCFSQRTNDQEYTDWELLELILAGSKPELVTQLDKLIASIESEDRALYVKAQKIVADHVWTEEEINEVNDILMQARINIPFGDTATDWMSRLATVDPVDTYSPMRPGSRDYPMPETLVHVRDNLAQSLAACGGP